MYRPKTDGNIITLLLCNRYKNVKNRRKIKLSKHVWGGRERVVRRRRRSHAHKPVVCFTFTVFSVLSNRISIF